MGKGPGNGPGNGSWVDAGGWLRHDGWVARDWVRWHEDYEDLGSSLSRRLVVVRGYLERALDEAPGDGGERRLISLCAGDGRDVLPVLVRHRGVSAVLVELDPELGERARAAAAELGLAGVQVRTGDAGLADTYLDAVPAHIVTACGVFGNVSRSDLRRTVAALPSLLVAGGIVIWTRGRGDDGPDPSSAVRACLAEHGFEEMAFTGPGDARFRVGMHRLVAAGAGPPPRRLFTFG